LILRDFKRMNHCESVRKHSNGTGFARVEAEKTTQLQLRGTLSLGSNQGNAHIHWHVAPLPSGVPYEKQQFHALMSEHGVLSLEEEDLTNLAAQLRAYLEGNPQDRCSAQCFVTPKTPFATLF
jgi:hypothetical protein